MSQHTEAQMAYLKMLAKATAARIRAFHYADGNALIIDAPTVLSGPWIQVRTNILVREDFYENERHKEAIAERMNEFVECVGKERFVRFGSRSSLNKQPGEALVDVYGGGVFVRASMRPLVEGGSPDILVGLSCIGAKSPTPKTTEVLPYVPEEAVCANAHKTP